jgi:hypothetical protein
VVNPLYWLVFSREYDQVRISGLVLLLYVWLRVVVVHMPPGVMLLVGPYYQIFRIDSNSFVEQSCRFFLERYQTATAEKLLTK